MKAHLIPERWTIIGVSVLMVLTLGLLVRGLAQNKESGRDLGELALGRTMDGQQWRLGLLTGSFAWDILQQKAHLSAQDTPNDGELIDNWLPLLRSRFAINVIGLANDRGDEHLLEHRDSTWRYTSTSRSTLPASARERTWSVRHQRNIPPPQAVAPQADPRESSWFSQALEDRHDQPIWTISDRGPGRIILHLSVLLRGRTDTDRYRVLHFDIDAAAMLGGLARPTPGTSTVLLTAQGQPMAPLDTTATGNAWRAALRDWIAERQASTFSQTTGEQQWLGRILPFDLNGSRLFIGAMVGLGPIEHWYNQGQAAIRAVIGLLILLGVLLTLVFVQSRKSDRRVQRQEHRSRVQADHLAQAIGEREVLDREVHHRVKNNLQVVSSLLNLQAQRMPEGNARSEFMRGKRRIDSMALVHHKLYRQTDLSSVDMRVFLDDVAKAISAMFEPDSRSVSHSVDTGGLRSNADTCIHLGMILCELLANCHQHAFPYATGGHIEIKVKEAGDGLYGLIVQDNGKGMGAEPPSDARLGLEIAAALAEQLDGSLRTEQLPDGTLVEVTFRMQPTRPVK